MIGRLAVRSLTAHPVRSAVLAAGFGVGVAVMAILLGIAEIVLQQARAPALVGGGDLVIHLAPNVPARLVLTGTLQADALRRRVRVAAPTHAVPLYLTHDGRTTPVDARGGIPSLERALGDPETAGAPAWTDSPADIEWTTDTPAHTLRAVDRFHPVPDAPDWSGSWAEWLYFNGRASGARFYLTFLVGSPRADGRRAAGVRLQLDRGAGMETFSATEPVTDAAAMRAPDLAIGASFVRLDGMRYVIHLDLRDARGRRARADLSLEASPGRLLPPLEIAGVRGWRTGYVVPVMSGKLDGQIAVDGRRVRLDGGTGYHDHNWGFWKGVSWQWGQVQQNDLSVLYGRVFPPPGAADPERLPGFVGVLGPDGPIGYTTDVTIAETNDARGNPKTIAVRARGAQVDLSVLFNVESAEVTRGGSGGPAASGLDFYQLRGTYNVDGRAGSAVLAFAAPGSAETFRGR